MPRPLRSGETFVALLCGMGWRASRQRRFEVGQWAKLRLERIELRVEAGLRLLEAGEEIDWGTLNGEMNRMVEEILGAQT